VERGKSVLARGSGYSYGDVALNAGNLVLETSGMSKILNWDAGSGLVKVEPGVSIGCLIDHVAPDGWWPPVVPGTVHPTMGGCVASNVHGKNNWNSGTIGDHITEMEVITSSGEVMTCGPRSNQELFRAVVGGVGMLGVISSITLQMRRVSSPLLHVEEFAAPDLDSMLSIFEARRHSADLLVGWVDGYAAGADLGRGLVQIGNYVDVSRGVYGSRSLGKYVSDRALGLIPHSLLWVMMKPVANDIAMQRVNQARYLLGSLRTGMVRYLPQSGFQFFHDFAPNWNRAFQPVGIVQYQMFVPGVAARDVFAAALEETHAMDVHPFLAVLKLHRRDGFLLSYGVDGYSLSLDFRMTSSNQKRLLGMLNKLTAQLVLPAGGRFYLAKDNTLKPDDAARSLGEDAVSEFLSAKRQIDPDDVFQSDLYRRLLHPGQSRGD
jgi:FAD/FMN-containing dehydrogenase